jgi:hypothetical protein
MVEEKKGIVDKLKDKLTDDDSAAAGLAGEQQESNLEGVESSQAAERG